MIRLFKYLFTGDWHLHKWKKVEEIKASASDGRVVRMSWVMQCKHCGDIKTVVVS